MEKEQRRYSYVGPKEPYLISVVDCDSAEKDAWEESPNGRVDIVAVEFVQGKRYTCPALTASKGKEVANSKMETFLFDISKADQIFYYLVKDKQIKFLEAHKIPLAEEIKGRKYFKWHYLWTHTTNNCIVFRNAIQKAIKDDRLKLAQNEDMTVDTNLFGMSINMMVVSITYKEQKNGKIPRWEKKLKEKDEARPSWKTVWRPKSTETQEARGQSSNHRVSVLQRLQYVGQFQNRIRYHNQLEKEFNQPNLVCKFKKLKQDVVPKITNHVLLKVLSMLWSLILRKEPLPSRSQYSTMSNLGQRK